MSYFEKALDDLARTIVHYYLGFKTFCNRAQVQTCRYAYFPAKVTARRLSTTQTRSGCTHPRFCTPTQNAPMHAGLPAQLHLRTAAHAHRETRACQGTICTQLYLSARKLHGDTQSHRGVHMQKPALRSCMQLVVVNVLCVVCAYFLAVAACRWFIVHVSSCCFTSIAAA